MPAIMIWWLALLLFQGACKDDDPPLPPDPPAKDSIGLADVWLTRGDQTKLLNADAGLTIKTKQSGTFPVIQLDTATAFQVMHGFGAALTGSSAYLLNKKMNATQREQVLRQLFDPQQGIGISYLRLTMGASDFSLADFSYDDMPAGQTDFNLEQFSLSRDLEDVVPVLKEIIAIAPDIQLMGTPWSPPAWMKTNGSMKGGKLKTTCYSVYADYFVKYIQAMKAQGIEIAAVTPQNEPLYFTAGYPCMEMQATEQLDFVRNHLGPKFQAAGITTKIIVYDHNWDVPQYAISILNDPVAKSFVAGSAFHAYGGDVTAMSTVHYAHPDKELYFTEISGGAWATNFKDNLMWNMQNIFIGTANNWSTTALMWNLALDQNYGPQNHGCSNCRGVIEVNISNGGYTPQVEYYSIGHFSKFVQPGAQRISSVIPAELNQMGFVAFLNPDGSKVLVAGNYSSTYRSFTVHQGNGYFNYSVPPEAEVTVVW